MIKQSFIRNISLVAFSVLGFSSAASAAVTVLTFEGIQPTYPYLDNPGLNPVFIQDFYNGGTSSAGTSGTNFGVTFSSNAATLCLNTIEVGCSNTSKGGQGLAGSDRGALAFYTQGQTFVNVAQGFDTGFSFSYASVSQGAVVNVYDGINGTGSILQTLFLRPNTTFGSCPLGYDGVPGDDGTRFEGTDFCPFSNVGVTFSGVARSIGFLGTPNQIAFDDITFGSEIVGGPRTSSSSSSSGSSSGGQVPEPASLSLIALGLIGLGRRKKSA